VPNTENRTFAGVDFAVFNFAGFDLAGFDLAGFDLAGGVGARSNPTAGRQFTAVALIKCNDGPNDSVWEFLLGATIPFRLGNIPGCLWSRVSFQRQALRFELCKRPNWVAELGEWLTEIPSRNAIQHQDRTTGLSKCAERMCSSLVFLGIACEVLWIERITQRRGNRCFFRM